MGLRKGFMLGFVAGAVAAAGLSQSQKVEAPAEEGESPSPQGRRLPFDNVVAEGRRYADEAKAAAQAAREEKEAELRRRFEEMTHRSTT